MSVAVVLFVILWYAGLVVLMNRYDHYGPNPWWIHALRWFYGIWAASPVLLLIGFVIYWMFLCLVPVGA